MPPLITDRIRYLHVPKTGGTWTIGAMQAAGVRFTIVERPSALMRPGHAGLAQLEDFADRFTIAFVRHPLDWWRSVWAHRMRLGWNAQHEIDSRARSDDFEDFIEQVVRNLPGHYGVRLARFIGPPEQPIEFIGRFESLVDDLVRALRTAEEPFDEDALRAHPPANVGDYLRFGRLYPLDLATRLAEAESATIRRFYAHDPAPARLIARPSASAGWRGRLSNARGGHGGSRAVLHRKGQP